MWGGGAADSGQLPRVGVLVMMLISSPPQAMVAAMHVIALMYSRRAPLSLHYDGATILPQHAVDMVLYQVPSEGTYSPEGTTCKRHNVFQKVNSFHQQKNRSYRSSFKLGMKVE